MSCCAFFRFAVAARPTCRSRSRNALRSSSARACRTRTRTLNQAAPERVHASAARRPRTSSNVSWPNTGGVYRVFNGRGGMELPEWACVRAGAGMIPAAGVLPTCRPRSTEAMRRGRRTGGRPRPIARYREILAG